MYLQKKRSFPCKKRTGVSNFNSHQHNVREIPTQIKMLSNLRGFQIIYVISNFLIKLESCSYVKCSSRKDHTDHAEFFT